MMTRKRLFMLLSIFTAAFIIQAGISTFGMDPRPAGWPGQSKPAAASAKISGLTLKEELSIGVREGDEKYMFGDSVSINVDDQGHIYALDWENKQVKKYGSDGKHILSFGRAGQGPGEFRNPGVVRFTKDGTLYISENFGNKIMFYDADGVYKSQMILDEKIFDIWITPAGTYLGQKQIAPQYVGEAPVETFIILFDAKFKPIVQFHAEVFEFPDRSLPPAKAQAEIASTFLARPSAMAEMGPDGRIFFGRNDKYAIDVYSPEGRKLQTISRDIPPAPYEKKDIDFLKKSYGESLASMMKSDALTEEYVRSIRFPKNKPFFRSLIPMDDGRLAVVADFEGLIAVSLDVFDRAGAFLGRVRAPIQASNLIFKKGKAYAVQRDDDGYSSIKRYACEWK